MEKVFKILIVFALLMLLILFSVRTRRWHEYGFSHRIPDMPSATEEPELLSSILSQEGIATVTDEGSGIVYQYHVGGTLFIFRRHSLKELQRLTVPAEGYFLSIDPIKDEIHLYHDGEVYIYNRS